MYRILDIGIERSQVSIFCIEFVIKKNLKNQPGLLTVYNVLGCDFVQSELVLFCFLQISLSGVLPCGLLQKRNVAIQNYIINQSMYPFDWSAVQQ